MSLRRLTRSRWFQRAAGLAAAEYLRLVWLTNKFSYDPPDLYQRIDPRMPLIATIWHGQHFMMPFVKLAYHRVKVLISRHGDGEINAVVVERLGSGTVRGSGDHGSAFHRKGGVGAFKALVRALEDKFNIVMTADVPKVARKAGLGIIMLARESGCPILPVGVATSRFRRLDNWDRSVINLPFGRGAIVGGDLIDVPADADDAAMEVLRGKLEASINDVTRRAYARVGREDEAPHG